MTKEKTYFRPDDLKTALGLVAWLASSEPLGLSWQTKDALNRLAFVVFPLLFAMLPLSLTAIVLRYRLWEIDFIINRSLVYGGLTALVILLYALGVSQPFPANQNPAPMAACLR